MATPINLNKARKVRAKSKRLAAAQENAVKFGRTKTQKLREDVDAAKTKRALDGHKVDP
jgi:hypothetical protein